LRGKGKGWRKGKDPAIPLVLADAEGGKRRKKVVQGKEKKEGKDRPDHRPPRVLFPTEKGQRGKGGKGGFKKIFLFNHRRGIGEENLPTKRKKKKNFNPH